MEIVYQFRGPAPLPKAYIQQVQEVYTSNRLWFVT